MITDHRLYKKSCEDMSEVEDESVHVVITSPPYNENKPYGIENRLDPRGQKITHGKNSDSKSMPRYIELLRNFMSESYRVLVPGGRLCINVAHLGRYNLSNKNTAYKPLTMLIFEIATELGMLYESEIIWYKRGNNLGTMWGSYQSPSAPSIRDIHEYIQVFSKPDLDGNKTRLEPPADIDDKKTIKSERFAKLTRSVWDIRARSNGNHPCVYPHELPRRLIELYSYPGQTVLDPFAGSGTTAEVAKELNRHSISYEIMPSYWPLIEDVTTQRSIEEWFLQQPTPAATKQ